MKFNLLLLFFVSILLFSCGSSKEITFKEMNNIKIQNIKADGTVQVTADAVMHNPRRVKAKVTYMECEVFIDDKKMAEVAQLKETKVPKRSDFAIPLETKISLKKVLGNALSLAKSALGDGKIDMKLDGVVKVKVFGKTFTVPFIYEEETPVSL